MRRAEMQERAEERAAEGAEDRMLTAAQVEALKVVLKVRSISVFVLVFGTVAGAVRRVQQLGYTDHMGHSELGEHRVQQVQYRVQSRWRVQQVAYSEWCASR